MKRLFAVLAFLCFASTVSLAQLGVYAGLTTSRLDTPNTARIYGSTFGAFYDTHHSFLDLGIDVRGTVLPSDNITRVNSITAGPRVVFHVPSIPLRPYGEALIGEAHIKTGQVIAYTDTGGLDAGVAVGADLQILPHIDWRVLDFSYSRLNAAHTYQNSLTTGIVLRIPFS